MFTKGFIEQTAKDYDISVYEVERISKIYPEDEFYERLEEHISSK